MESSAVREAAQESSPTKRPLGEDNDDALIEKAEAKKMKLEAEVRKEAETEAEAKKMKVEAEVRNESFINSLGEEKDNDKEAVKNDNDKEADKNDNDKQGDKANVFGDASPNPRDSNNSNSNPRDANFTSEIFKIEIHGLPRHTGYGQLKKFLLKLGLESKKVSSV